MVPSTHSKTRSFLSSLALAAFLLATPSASQAQEAEKKPTPSEMEQAKKHYTDALDHHGHKEYRAAAREYEKAFALFPNPEFVFNAAQVYRLAGDVRTALAQYQRYLELDKEGRGAGDARAHIATLKIELEKLEREEREQAQATKEEEAEKKRQAEEDRRLEAEARAAALQANNRPPPDPGSQSLRIGGLATAGLGLVSLAIGGKFGLDAKGYEQDVTGNTVWSQQDFEDGQDAERMAYLFFGVGGAAIATGGVLYWLGMGEGRQAGEESQIAITPLPGKSGAGFLVQGSF